MRRQKRTYNSRTLVFLAIAVVLVVVLDRVIDPIRPPAQESMPDAVEIAQDEAPPTREITVPFARPYDLSTDLIGDVKPALSLSPWQAYAVPVVRDASKPAIAIIIDDMGMDRRKSRAVMDLPGPLTLAFLPYADDLDRQTADARDKGHELMVHVPMEPMNGGQDSGPNTLRSNMEKAAFYEALNANLFAFTGFVGINNHMGSKLTQDRTAMDLLMADLKGRGYLFIDSRTINTSVAAESAAAHGVPHAVRDVFIDHEETYEFATDALAEIERIARRKGAAIAIGHPKENTIAALKAWLPTLEEKGFQLVPVSALVKDGTEPD